MIPLKLELGGFTCFRDATEISFDDLSLFAIEGATGSGKSTLLDAMTYALYGQTARLGKQGVQGSLMSPGADQLFVTFTFENQHGKFRAARVTERKPGGSLSNNVRIEQLDEQANWRQLPETEKISEASAAIERIVGLDYEGFTRAVLLPQGAFDEFLRGDAKKRRDLLSNLLTLDRVKAIQQAANARASAAKAQQEAITERLEQDYAGATPERLRDVQRELDTLKEDTARRERERVRLQEERKQVEELKTLSDEHAAALKRLDGLKARVPEMERAKAQREQARQASQLLPWLERLSKQQAKLDAAQKALGAAETARNLQEKAKREAQLQYDEARRGAARLPDISRQLEALAGLAPLLKQLEDLGGRLAFADEAVPEVAFSASNWDEVRQQVAQLPALSRAHKDVRTSHKAHQAARDELAKVEARVRTLEQSLKHLKQKGRAAREVFERAKESYEQALGEHRAAALRAHLQLGDPCPVCHQKVAALPKDDHSPLEPLMSALDQAEKTLLDFREQYQECEAELKAAQQRVGDLHKDAERAEQRLAAHKETLRDIQQAFQGLPDDEAALQRMLELQERQLLASLAQDIRKRAAGLDPKTAPAALARERQTLEERLKTSESAVQQAQAELERRSAQQETALARLKELQLEQQEADTEFTKALASTPFGSPEALRAAALDATELARLSTELESFQAELGAAQGRELDLQAKLAGRKFDEDGYQQLKAALQSADTVLSELQRRLGSASRELEGLEQQLEKAKQLRADYQRHGRTYDIYRQLSLDLRGNKFPDFLLSRVQQELAIRASQIIRTVTENRYDLRLADNEYQVLDAWHGGEVRSAKTLSGGESFIASLALALALSDTLAGRTVLGALFLDEGFGTLDRETLESVAEVLESLTEQGRMVAVVTHVTALSERLPVRLHVEKGAEGSTVSWDV